MVAPVIIAALLASAATVGAQGMSAAKARRAARLRSKETQRETKTDLFDAAQSRRAELESSGLSSRGKMNKSRSRSMMDTASNFREALNI